MNVSGKVVRHRVTIATLLRRGPTAQQQAEWWADIERKRAERKALAKAE